jgi:hypothetical protein
VTLWAWLGRLAVKACHGGYCAAFRTLLQGGSGLMRGKAAKADDCQIWQQEEDGTDHCAWFDGAKRQNRSDCPARAE